MNFSEALDIAERHLDHIRKKCTFEITINPKITEEYTIGYLFFYNTKKYWETMDFSDSLAGNGPLLVLHKTKDVIELPTNRSIESSLDLISKSLL